MRIVYPEMEFLSGHVNGDVILAHVARMGRICYQSEGKTSDADFVRRLIKRGHESVLEHAKISVIVTCDRGITHEIVRHRIASYSQESTRYCNYSRDKFDSQITYIDIMNGLSLDPKTADLSLEAQSAIFSEWLKACMDAEKHYMRMLELGASPQIARSVLNNSTKTQIGMTMNLREWRHFFRLRCAKDAHPQMRELALMMLETFRAALPVVFDDLAEVHPHG